MKKLIFIGIVILITTVLSAQSVKTTCSWNEAALRVSPNVDSACIVNVPLDAPIVVIAKANELYYKVSYKTDTGYMKIFCIVHVFTNKNGRNTNDSKLFDDVPYEDPIKEFDRIINENTDITVEGARKMYGDENNKNLYKSNGYDYITLVWHCANGKYRSITYVMNNGYKKESEYVSDCIR